MSKWTCDFCYGLWTFLQKCIRLPYSITNGTLILFIMACGISGKVLPSQPPSQPRSAIGRHRIRISVWRWLRSHGYELWRHPMAPGSPESETQRQSGEINQFSINTLALSIYHACGCIQALVVPAFEALPVDPLEKLAPPVDLSTYEYPENKSTLLKQERKGLVEPFQWVV